MLFDFVKQFLDRHRALILLGRTYHKANNIPKTIECFEKAYQIRLKTLGAEHKDTVAVRDMLEKLK